MQLQLPIILTKVEGRIANVIYELGSDLFEDWHRPEVRHSLKIHGAQIDGETELSRSCFGYDEWR